MSTSDQKRFLKRKINIDAKMASGVTPKVVQDARNFDGSGVFERTKENDSSYSEREHALSRKVTA